jgi:hypothetical protein
MSFYKSKSKHIHMRAGNGRFRQTTLADIGLACCEVCDVLFTPAIPDRGGPIDPRDFHKLTRLCPNHGGQGEQTGLVAKR